MQSQSDSGKGEKGHPGLHGISFNLTDDGNFDLDGKRLTDVADPTDKGDATTKGYVVGENAKQDIAIKSKAEKADVLFLDGSQAMSDNLNMNDKKIINLETPTDGNDGATKQYVDDQIHLHTNKIFDKRTDSYDLHPNFTFYNIPLVDLIIPSSQVNSFKKDHQHGKIYHSSLGIRDYFLKA